MVRQAGREPKRARESERERGERETTGYEPLDQNLASERRSGPRWARECPLFLST